MCTCARLPVVQVEHKAEKTSVDMLVELNKNNVALVSEFKVFNKAFIAAQVAAANATKTAEVTQLQLVQQAAASGECRRSDRGACVSPGAIRAAHDMAAAFANAAAAAMCCTCASVRVRATTFNLLPTRFHSCQHS